MASSLPCVVSYECGCYTELIKNKNTGWGVDPQNEFELANIFHEIDNTGKEEFIEKQRNCLKVIDETLVYMFERF